jgi:subtilase family serine protease
VSGIEGLSKIPPVSHHTQVRPTSYDPATHRWQRLDSGGGVAAVSPADSAGSGYYNLTPQDYYTIYNVNPVFTGGNLGANATVAVIEETDIEYGDVTTFRNMFGVPGTLNMHVYHGYGSVTCNDPGIVNDGEPVEAALDAEWANALAPSANLIFMSCDGNGIFTSMAALIDNNLADVMSLSYGETEIGFTSSDYSFFDTLYSQAATQGQSFFVSAGDSGSDVADQNTYGTATSGINVTAFGGPNVTVAGGTDFSDLYDSLEGGPAQSTYWGANSTYYGDALGYIPETTWNDSCASSILTKLEGYTGAGYCALGPGTNPYINGDVVAGSGGFSKHYAVPAYQSGTTGYSGTKRAQPDISGFAANGIWGHALIFCDSYAGDQGGGPITCASSSSFGEAGGTSFVAPSLAGVTGLLVNSAGRQGLLNPALYALAKAQFTGAATATACYSNGQTSNTGVTAGLPASGCIFNDVTTSNNDVPCAAGSTNCYVKSGAPDGMLSVTNASSLTVAYPSTIGYDEATGIGTVNVYNLITNWNTAFTSTTGLTAVPTTISSTQSTTLTATVTGGLPAGQYSGSTYTPALSGTVNFAAGSTALGSCPLSSGSCQLVVSGSALQSGANSITATFTGSGTYPTSTSSIVPVTVTGSTTSSTTAVTLTAGANPSTYGASLTFRAAVTTGATGSVSFYNEASGASCLSLGASTPIGSTQTLSGGAASVTTTTLPVGSDTVLACYGGDSTYSSSSGTLGQTVNTATKTSSTTAVTLTAGANPSTYGASLTFRAAVTTGATGSVSFYKEASGASCLSLGASTPIGGTQTLSGGSASVTTTTLAIGSDTILACYGGDSTYSSSSGTLAHTVNKSGPGTGPGVTPLAPRP